MPLISSHNKTVPVTVQVRCGATPAEAFAVVVPIDLARIFTAWGPFPGVRRSLNQTGDWDTVGEQRNPDLTDGSTADERLTEYTPGHSFAYELSNFTGSLRRLIAGVRGEWTFTPDGRSTVMRWTYEFKPLPGRITLFQVVVAPLWRRYAGRAITRAACAAEADTSR